MRRDEGVGGDERRGEMRGMRGGYECAKAQELGVRKM